MKKMKFILATIAVFCMIVLTSCSENEKTISGTSWVNETATMERTMNFTSATEGNVVIVPIDEDGVRQAPEVTPFTYSFDDPIVRMTMVVTAVGETPVTFTGTARGRDLRMNMPTPTEANPDAQTSTVFTRQ